MSVPFRSRALVVILCRPRRPCCRAGTLDPSGSPAGEVHARRRADVGVGRRHLGRRERERGGGRSPGDGLRPRDGGRPAELSRLLPRGDHDLRRGRGLHSDTAETRRGRPRPPVRPVRRGERRWRRGPDHRRPSPCRRTRLHAGARLRLSRSRQQEGPAGRDDRRRRGARRPARRNQRGVQRADARGSRGRSRRRRAVRVERSDIPLRRRRGGAARWADQTSLGQRDPGQPDPDPLPG